MVLKLIFFSIVSRGYISAGGWKTKLCDITEFNSANHFSDYVATNEIKALIVIHAYRGGKLLKGKQQKVLNQKRYNFSIFLMLKKLCKQSHSTNLRC